MDSDDWKIDIKNVITTFSNIFQGWSTLHHDCKMRGHSCIHCSVSLSHSSTHRQQWMLIVTFLRKKLCPRKTRSWRVLLWFPIFSNFWSHGWRGWLAIGYNQRSMVLIFNSKLTDSVECSLKQPRSSEFRWLYNICEDLEGVGGRNSRDAVVIHSMHPKPYLKKKKEEAWFLQPRVWQTSTSHCVREKDLFHWAKKKKKKKGLSWLSSRDEFISLLMTRRICYSK